MKKEKETKVEKALLEVDKILIKHKLSNAESVYLLDCLKLFILYQEITGE